MGAGFNNRCHTLLERANGELLAGGDMTVSGSVFPKHVARWNGSNWKRLGDGTNASVFALATMPNGDLIATGRFSTADDLPANKIARWDGYGWTAMGSGLVGSSTNASGNALLVQPEGELLVGGNFLLADNTVSVAMARFVSTCRATATMVGTGCIGGTSPGAGPYTLQHGVAFQPAAGESSVSGAVAFDDDAGEFLIAYGRRLGGGSATTEVRRYAHPVAPAPTLSGLGCGSGQLQWQGTQLIGSSHSGLNMTNVPPGR